MVFNVCFYVTAAFKSWRLSRRREPWVSRAAGPPAARRALQRERLCSAEKMHFCGSCGSLCFLGEGKRRLEHRSAAPVRSGAGDRHWEGLRCLSWHGARSLPAVGPVCWVPWGSRGGCTVHPLAGAAVAAG